MTLFKHVMAGTTPGEEWSCSLHTTGSGTLAAAQSAFNSAVGAFWTGELDTIVTTDVSLTETSTASLDPVTGKQISRLMNDVTLPGTLSTEMLPYQCASGVSWRTALATRSGRGRMYLPPLAVGVLDTGRLSSSAVSTIIDAVGQLTDSLDGGGLALVLLNRSTMVTTPVTSVDVGNVIDTQRRRRNKLIEVRVSSPVP